MPAAARTLSLIEDLTLLTLASIAAWRVFLRLTVDSTTPTLVLGAIALTVVLGLAFSSTAACFGRVARAGR